MNVFLGVPLALIFLVVIEEIVEVNHAILATGSEAHVVGVPVNAHNASNVTSKLHSIQTVTCEEVVNIDVLFMRNAGKEMATVGKPDLVAALDLQSLELVNLRAENIAHGDFVLQSNHQVQSTWMESQSEAFFGLSGANLMRLCRVVPNVDSFVS